MVHLGDVGTLIELDTEEDLSGATSPKIMARKPDGTVVVWDAVIDDTKLTYTTEAGDIDAYGYWDLQGAVVLGSWTGATAVVTEEIGERLANPYA